MGEITWSRSSFKDLKQIFDYISRDSEVYAIRLIERLIARVDILEDFPLSGRIVPEKEDKTIRELIEGNYRIFYQVSDDKIFILRIHHGARNIK
jgi:toxin ParE1/3/4